MQNEAGNGHERPLLSVRATLIFLAAMFLGTIVGALTLASGSEVPQALLAAAVTAGAAVPALHRIIGGTTDS
ncbi:hypothetical protein ACPB9J_31680 [Streptomyces lavendulocolor]|uniref:hypothetical protein n=1 Tax=Streptomyces lavendulocolor TaxID=67316 RepID=UPI003C2B4513